ncbi:MAG: AraC family ligand binding domain-containing protein [Chloroflexi bacterium]|nr:AraC family ligand binding domain-containing protein [Chloroflexota bacterium]
MSFYRPEDLTHLEADGIQRNVAFENSTLFLRIENEAGHRSTPHAHTWPTLYYIVSGEGRVLIGDRWHEVGPGCLAMTPPNTMHGVEARTRMSLVEVQSNCESWFAEAILAGKSSSTPRQSS